MLRSLVGSEMCIRDSINAEYGGNGAQLAHHHHPQSIMDEDDMFPMDDGAAIPDPADAAFEAQSKEEPSGVPAAWCVSNLKSWQMDQIASGNIEECRAALEAGIIESEAKKGGKPRKERPFFYVTTLGEPPEMESEPFTSMNFTAFPAYCDATAVASLAVLEGVRALEIRRTKTVPCLLYTSDAADEEDSVDLGGRRIIKKKKKSVKNMTREV
eukprot:TRINITY_DN12210_c0_g1_i3.p1 TRINITY_DN12210_c0_g1~~TRINITY_DN12210_c0_g1_i3.p1  ORF type:complete len:242 (+),score=73.74 TRINITY_DN12210_c0_g1_i3:88-726(+)